MGSIARNIYRVYVSNLPWTVSHQELKKYFSKFGFVSSANVIFDKNTGLSRNYGFVVFNSRESFENACNQNSHILEGNNLKVQPSSGTSEN